MRVAWIGAGIMGQPMCSHLVNAGHDVNVFTRRRVSAQGLVSRGAKWCTSPAEASTDADVTFTMVGYPDDVRSVVLGDEGVLQAAAPGSIVVDMTTSEPALAVEVAERAQDGGVEALDAPVSGGEVGAKAATLTIMVGGRRPTFDRAAPLLGELGSRVTYMGAAGSGQHAKMMNQIAIASGMIGVCEALVYGAAAGLDVSTAIEVLGAGAAGSWSLSAYGPRVLADEYAPGFKIDHFVKDLGIALSEARRMNLALPGLALAEQLYMVAQGDGLGQSGTHALALIVRARSAGARSVAVDSDAMCEARDDDYGPACNARRF